MIKYDGDERAYFKYKKTGSTHYYVDCTAKKKMIMKEDNLYVHILEKEKINIKKNWEMVIFTNAFLLSKNQKQLYWIFFHRKKKEEKCVMYSENGLKQRLSVLIGEKKLSVEVGASKEMYDFIIYCISYGIFI